MPVSVGVGIGRKGTVALKRAVLLYESGGYESKDAFTTVHDITGLDEGQPALAAGRLLTVEGLREINKALYKQQRLVVLPEQVLAVTNERLAWHEPARMRVMFFKTQDAFLNNLSGSSFPQPPLLFIAGERQLKVFALTIEGRPTGETRVFTAPYFNTTTSGVCLGSTPLPDSLSVQDTEGYSSAFFHSAFTHGTSERLVQGWGGSYGEIWAQAQRLGVFPEKHLIATQKTVGEAINA
ncbi:MAG: PRTRC system protein B [Deinococcota bacterium]|nr:PRTRC system protein B [Deinococcota bacterium]